MKKIVYLFGAGASKQVLPIVNEILDRLNKLIEKLELEEFQLSDTETYTSTFKGNKRNSQKELITDLKWLRNESSKHSSIDTYAKKLYIKNEINSLHKLKILLSVFFIFEQLGKRPDERYDTFFASILGEDSRAFPKQLQILSWNYDYQFELAYSEYNNSNSIYNTPLNTAFKLRDNDFFKNNNFAILKLNGSTIFKKIDDKSSYFYFLKDLKKDFTKETISEIVYDYCLATFFPDNFFPHLSFAWEQGGIENNIVKQSIDATKDASVLVVIGYSFPFFNRDVDRKIIGSMINLEKVYFQAPDANVLLERFQAINDKIPRNKLVDKYDLGQFLLPNEL